MREPCHAATKNCLSPAGWGNSWGHYTKTELLDLDPCYRCGEAVCDNCSTIVEDKRLCCYCQDEVKRTPETMDSTSTVDFISCCCSSCDWQGAIYNCEPDIDGDGNFGCPVCKNVVKAKDN